MSKKKKEKIIYFHPIYLKEANAQQNTLLLKFIALPLTPIGSLNVQLQSSTFGRCEALLGQLAAEGEENVSH